MLIQTANVILTQTKGAGPVRFISPGVVEEHPGADLHNFMKGCIKSF